MMFSVTAILVTAMRLAAVTAYCPVYAIDLRTVGSAAPTDDVTCISPAVPCPAVLTSTSVLFVYCHKDNEDVDCSLPMTSGTTAVSRCNFGYHIAGDKKSKTSTCSSDGTWSDAMVTCVKDRTGYQQIAGLTNLYKHHNIKLSWQDAKSSCEAEGTHLVILNSNAEYAAVIDLMKKNQHKVLGNEWTRGYSWVGVKQSDAKPYWYYTVLGQPQADTGFNTWARGTPIHPPLWDGVFIHTSYSGMSDWPDPTDYQWAYICELEV